MTARIGSIVAVCLLLVASCRQDEPNGPCGSLVKALCSSPMECITVGPSDAKKICVKPCDATNIDCPPPGCCPSGSTCRPIDRVVKRVGTAEQGFGIAWFCVPTAEL